MGNSHSNNQQDATEVKDDPDAAEKLIPKKVYFWNL